MVYVLGFVAFCIAWLLPGHYFPWHSFQQEVVAGIGALLLALAAVASPDVRRLPLPRIALGTLAFALVPLVQWKFGKVPYLADALLSAAYLCAFGLTIAASAALARAGREQFVGGVFGSLIVAALASTGIGLVQWLQLGPLAMTENLAPGGRVYANLTQPNHLASLIGIAIAAVAWLFETRRIGRWVALLALSFLGFGLVMTQARIGWIIVVVFVVWWWIAHKKASLRSTWPGVAGAVMAFFAMTLLWAPLNAALDSSTATVLSERVQVVGGRGIHWPALWDAAWQQPLWGWGWMQVGAAQQAVALDHPRSYEWITYSHSLLLDLLVWNGMVLGTLAIVGVGWWAVSRCINCRDATTWSLLAAGGALAAYALVEFPHAYTFFLLPMAVFVGAVEASRAPSAVSGELTMPKWAFGIAGLSMAGLLAWICIDYLEVEEASRRTSLKEAGYVAQGQEPRPPDVMLLDNQRDFVWFRLTEAREGMPALDIERMRRISQRYMPPAVLLRYALAAGLNDHPAEATRSLQLICHMWPTSNCEQGRISWRLLRERFPKLRSIDYPEPPKATP